jgi:hypothetical protein
VTEDLECAAARELLGELAAGVAAGEDRARVLDHLSGCAECRSELASAADVVDELLLLAPAHEPPPRFASAVMARIDPAGARLRPRWPALLRVASVVAVVGLAAGLAAGAVWWRTADDRETARHYRDTLAIAHGERFSATPLLLRGGAETGTVFAYQGSPSWVYVAFRSPPAPGEYQVRLQTRDGRRVALRPFTARPGQTGWGTAIQVPVEQIRTIELVSSGVPVMSARFD